MEMWSYRYNLKQWKPILYIFIDVYMHTEKKKQLNSMFDEN